MTERKKKIRIGNAFLTGALFFLSGIQFFGEGKDLLGIVQITGGILNFIDGANIKKKFFNDKNLFYALGIANIIIPVTIAVDYFQSGTKYIQYVWVLVAILGIVAFTIRLKKQK